MKGFKKITAADVKTIIIDVKHKDSLIDVPVGSVVNYKNTLYIKVI
jgi:hypothetical protein